MEEEKRKGKANVEEGLIGEEVEEEVLPAQTQFQDDEEEDDDIFA